VNSFFPEKEKVEARILNVLLLLLFCWGYTVTFAKFLQCIIVEFSPPSFSFIPFPPFLE
jgi:hypothetical protein